MKYFQCRISCEAPSWRSNGHYAGILYSSAETIQQNKKPREWIWAADKGLPYRLWFRYYIRRQTGDS
jgi:hypothetical protein